MPPRRIVVSILLVLATLVLGLSVRFAPLGLPPYVVKYGASALWALMLYWIVSTLLPSRRVLTAALLTAALTATVECIKLCHSPGLDAFRMTLAGRLLLGRFFSLWDIVAYWLAIALGALLDRALCPRPWHL